MAVAALGRPCRLKVRACSQAEAGGTRWEKELTAGEVCFGKKVRRLLRFCGMLRWAGIWVQAWPIVAWQAGRADPESLISFSYFSAEPCRVWNLGATPFSFLQHWGFRRKNH
jgi:hypothetical protein